MTDRRFSKHNTANLFNRYIWLVDTIYRREKITFDEISGLWSDSSLNDSGEDLPLRTFHNHRTAIEEMFSIIIECDKSDGYKYFIENRDEMEKDGVRSWLLNTFTINRLINESHKIKNRIIFEQIPSGQRYLTPIIEAMRDELTIEMTYQSFWSDEPTTFEIEPYCVKVFKQRWYVVARSLYFDAIRIYSLDRIQNLCISENSFKLPKSFCPETFFNNAFGIIVDKDIAPCTVLIKVLGKQRKYLQTLPLHHSQEEIETNDNDSVFSYFLSPTFDFKQEILSHGAVIEVLEPEWFREEVIETVSEMNEIYF